MFVERKNPNKPKHGITSGDLWMAGGKILKIEIKEDGNTLIISSTTDDGADYRVRDEITGELTEPTIEWLRTQYKEGRAEPIGQPKDVEQYLVRNEVCDLADRPQLLALYRLACRAIDAGIKRTDTACAAWLAENYGTMASDNDTPLPSGCTLRRQMSLILKNGRNPSSLVRPRGRKWGQSPLCPQVDAFLTESALYYWAGPGVLQRDARTYLEMKIAKFNADHPERDPLKLPSAEALRERIRRFASAETARTKFGAEEAASRYRGSGPTIDVQNLLQLVLMDATNLEQIMALSEEHALPATRVRLAAMLDLKSHVLVGWHIYVGPNRTEASVEAIISTMCPPDVSPEMLAVHKDLAWLFGKPGAILCDNEKALIGHQTIASLNDLGIDVKPTKVAYPQGKAILERLFRTLKQRLARLPGTVVDPKRAKMMDYDFKGIRCLTIHQLREIFAQVVAEYHTTPSSALGGETPLQCWQRLAALHPPKVFGELSHVRRCLARRGNGLLTRDGIEVNGVRYRDRYPNAIKNVLQSSVSRLLSSYAQTDSARFNRKDNSVTAKVEYRIPPGNIDTLQIQDPINKEWVTLYSTQPDYTFKLSEWEHKEFQKQAKLRNERFVTQAQRLASKEATLRLIEKMLPDVAFQQRRTLAALYVNETVKERAGSSLTLGIPADLQLPADSSEQTIIDSGDKRGRSPVSSSSVPADFIPECDRDSGYVDFDSIKLDAKILRDLGISEEDPLDLDGDEGGAA